MSNIIITIVKQASDVPQAALDALNDHQARANPILPTLLQCLAKERAGTPTRDHIWAIVSHRRNPNHVRFVLSITNSILSTYPVFLFTTISYQDQDFNKFIPPMHALVRQLRAYGVSRSRIYSVFGPEALAKAFAYSWTEFTGIPVTETYYDSWLATITPETFVSGTAPSFDTQILQFCPATVHDIHGVASLCFKFAETSPPFQITKEQAYLEAEYLVNNQLVWVCRAWSNTHQKWRVVSLVAYTRNTPTSATITKVYTLESARGDGIALKLTNTVCRHLFSHGKREISLFVGVENKAGFVYKRLGFPVPPMPPQGQPTPSHSEMHAPERWIEYGFHRDRVTLGIW
ncbi:hypothetical protein BJ165DRAFT_1526860 [Panaeolus papilionaceus]|nr:hypothetical protein BJ165DRAFT_1526860 [Panaeolus papilionaceus]